MRADLADDGLMKVALLAGTSIVNSEVFRDWEEFPVQTAYGEVRCRRHGDQLVLNRHGFGVPLLPHAVPHRANIRALADLGVTEVIALSSVGSLHPELRPGTLVSCSDYVALQQGPVTFRPDWGRAAGDPGMPNRLIPQLAADLAPEFPVETGKVYVQMRGPRFETRAEIAVIRHWGDVVGMTAAHEADLCLEAGLGYNHLGMVDNYANGIAGEAIDDDRFNAMVRANQARMDALCRRILSFLEAGKERVR